MTSSFFSDARPRPTLMERARLAFLSRQPAKREAAPVFVPASNADLDIAANMAKIDALEIDGNAPKSVEPSKHFRKTDDLDDVALIDALPCDFSDLPASSRIVVDECALVRIADRPSLTMEDRSTEDATESSSSLSRQFSVLGLLFRLWKKREPYRKAAEPHTKRLATKKTNEAKAEARAARRTPPPWKRADEFTRLPFYSDAILETGRAVAFALNISPSVLEAAEASKDGVLDYVRRRITWRLTGLLKGSLAMAVCLDADKDGRLHVHGLVECPSGDLQALASALRLAGGEWLNKSGKRHQVWLQDDQRQLIGEDFFPTQKPLNAGWLSYSAKHAAGLKMLNGHKAIYTSSSVKNWAKENYNALSAARWIRDRSVTTD